MISQIIRRWAPLLASSVLCASLQAETGWQQLSTEERDRLAAGEILLLQREAGTGRGGARAALLVQAPAERTWNVVMSCDKARVYMAGMEHCEVLERRDDYALTRHVIDRGWLTPEMDYTFETRAEPYRRMDIERVEGDLDTLHGWWSFEPTGEGLLLQHDITVDPSIPAPRWLVRRSIAEDLPDMMRCIRALADGSASQEQAEADREACPGNPER